jgi:formylglycine-generating enzyme required for sulfatase activity
MKTATHRGLACLLALTAVGLFVAAQADKAEAPRAAPDGKVITNSIGMKLASIPAGKFLMGSPPDEKERNANEEQHEVIITKPFYMGVYEVTQGEFEQVMGKAWMKANYVTAHFNEANGGGPDYPMDNVLWRHAVEFCTKLSELPAEKEAGRRYRLPTEAEWEYACRAGTTTAFHYGDTLSSSQANCNGNFPYGGAEKGPYLRKTTKVGSYKPNAFGLYDMHGNVAEWCSDWYDKDYYRNSPKEDPKGPAKGVLPTGYKNRGTPGEGEFYRVIRGGCWLDDARGCRSAYRYRAMATDGYRLIGLRVVCEVEKAP